MQIPSICKTSSFRNLRNSQSKTSLPHQKTIHSGWLWKKGLLHKAGLTNRRWFVIKGDQLYYFKDKEDVYPLGQISLPGNKIKRHPPVADTSGKYVFEIVAGKEREGRPVAEHFDSLLFAADTPYKMEEWIKAINQVIFTPLGGGMFGRSITTTVKIDARRGGGDVPIVVEQCVEYLRKYGFQEEGIFRVPGCKDDVEALKGAFNTGELKDLSEGAYKVHIVASVLKQYIGDLPEPVIPSENYDQFMAVSGLYKTDPEAALEKFHHLLQTLPVEHYNLLRYISRFLYELQNHHSITKMTIANLALIFGPNLLRPQGDDPDLLLKSLSDVNRITMAIVMAHEKLFPATEEEKRYSPKDEKANLSMVFDLIDFDKTEQSSLSAPITPVKPRSSFTTMKRALSDGSIDGLVNFEKCYADKDETTRLKCELEEQRIRYEGQIQELENKVEAEVKIREMIKIRLVEEHRARVHAEERLELYRTGIEDYCRKFGHADITIQ